MRTYYIKNSSLFSAALTFSLGTKPDLFGNLPRSRRDLHNRSRPRLGHYHGMNRTMPLSPILALSFSATYLQPPSVTLAPWHRPQQHHLRSLHLVFPHSTRTDDPLSYPSLSSPLYIPRYYSESAPASLSTWIKTPQIP